MQQKVVAVKMESVTIFKIVCLLKKYNLKKRCFYLDSKKNLTQYLKSTVKNLT
jgi:hypothetical protein